MILSYSINALMIITFTINSLVQGLEIVYYKDLSAGVSCSSLFSQYWSMVSATYSSSYLCQYSCTRSDNSNTAYILAPEMSHYPNGLQVTEPLIQPYSIIGADIVYLRKTDSLTVSVFDGSTKIFSQDYTGANQGTKIEYNYSLSCSAFSGDMTVSKEVIQINNRLASSLAILRFKQSVTSPWSWYGILKVRIWTNCVENCQGCADNTNCNTCLLGFKRYSLSSGQKVCEQTYNCNISNCFSCIKSSPSSPATCVKCLPGYTLNASSTCDLNSGSCAAGKYQSVSSGCVSYSANCYMQVQNSNISWTACSSVVAKSNYKCLITEEILIYEHRNYSLFSCSCRIQFCVQCPTAGQCAQCLDGYTFNATTQKCEFNTCPLLYTQDPFTGECLKNCSGQNCQECDSTQCLVCNQLGNYYVTSSDTHNCALCTISNCQKCSGDGLCQKCANLFQLSTDKSSCSPCSVSECGQCQPGQSDTCQTCSTGYILSADQKSCNCGVQNCFVCNLNDGGICDSCQTGYLISIDQSTCSCDAKHCSVCNAANGSKCDTCVSGYIQDPTTFKCKCAVDNCATCNGTDGTICDSCISDYLPVSTSTNTCSCQVYGCSKCNQASGLVCDTCNPNYTLFNQIQCKCSVANCSTCHPTDGSICDTCVYNYLQDITNTTCSCQINSCVACHPSNGKICISPNPGYTFDQGQQKNVCNFLNCKTCNVSDGTICEQCIDGYVRDPATQQCVCAVQNCSQCNVINGAICDSCTMGYALSADKQQCNCGVNNCINCNSSNGSLCDQCVQGYLTNKCVCNVQNCANCQSNDGTYCSACVSGYSLSQSKQQCSCDIQYCLTCDKNNGTVCTQCFAEYTLSQMQPIVGCKLNCNIQNCIECEDPPNNKTSCKTCASGYEWNPLTLQCVNSECKVRMCKQCKQYLTDICEVCADSYELNSQFQCFLKERNDYEINQKVVENIGYNVTLKFYNQIVIVNNDLNTLLKVEIQNYQQPFQINFDYSEQQTQINLELILNENCKDKYLLIEMYDPKFVQINNLQDSQQKEVKLSEYIKKTEEQKQQVQVTKTATQAAATTLTNTMILLVILGNSYVLFSTIDLTTFIYFLLFINVRYPDNMIAFCAIFKNFQFAFIPNLIQQLFIEPGYIQPYTPQKFIDNGADAYFFNGAGQSFTIVTGIMIIYGCLKLLTLMPISSVKVYVNTKIKSGWEYCGFLDLIGCCYMYVLVSALLQFYCLEFDESLSFLNYSLCSFCLIAVFFIPVWMAIFISKMKDLTNPDVQMQYASLIGGFKIQPPVQELKKSDKIHLLENTKLDGKDQQQCTEPKELTKHEKLMYKWSRYTNVLLYTRKLIYAMIVIFLYDHVYLQMILVNIMNIFLAYFYLYISPQEEKYANIRNGISELFLIIIQITVCLLVKDDEDQDEQDRYNIGWVIIACSSTILAMHIFNVILDLLKTTFNLVKDFICTLIKPKKELDRIKREKLGEIDGSQNKLFPLSSQFSISKIRTMNKKLSTIIIQNQDSPRRQETSQPLRKLKLNTMLIKSVMSLSSKISPLKNDKSGIFEKENQKHELHQENGQGNLCQSPLSKISANSQINIEQSSLLNNQNQTLNQLFSSKQKISAPPSLNVSNNELAFNKIPSTSHLF